MALHTSAPATPPESWTSTYTTASAGEILRSAASVAVTAGLKCAPDAPPSVYTSIASTKTWSSPMTAQSVPPHVDARRGAGAHADAAERVDALRPAVIGARPGVVEVLVDDRVARARAPAVHEDEVDVLALAHDVLLRPAGRRDVAVEALVGAEEHEQAEHDQQPAGRGRPDPPSRARAVLALLGSGARHGRGSVRVGAPVWA